MASVTTSPNAAIPHDGRGDSTLAFLREGYAFGLRRFSRLRTDAFTTRLMLTPAICVMGSEATHMFYRPGRFTRRGALPRSTVRLLQDKRSVQRLDGAAHRARKALFLAIASDESVARLGEAFSAQWIRALARWRDMPELVLLDEVRRVLCEAVCAWAGVPLSEEDAARRTYEFGAMVDGAGATGTRLARGLALRWRTERWARGLVRDVRSRALQPPSESALRAIALHRDERGELLDEKTAAVELINVLRPTCAVDRYITFTALALHEHPSYRAALERGNGGATERFAQEVRRFYPFIPMMGGRALDEFGWRGQRIAKDAWVLLDIYATLHDPHLWQAPFEFRPERFVARVPGAYDLVPQGGGSAASGHRCPGERATLALMKRAVALLTGAMRYAVPPQDTSVDLARIPARPRSGLVIRGVRPRD